MKKPLLQFTMTILLAILLCFIFSCQQQRVRVAEKATPVVDIRAEKAKIQSLLSSYEQAWENEDIGLLMRIIAHDSDMVMFDIDTVKRLVGWRERIESAKKKFEATEKTKISTRDVVIKVHESGKVAWFSGIMDGKTVAQNKAVNLEGLRFTCVVEKRSRNWVMVQWHLSHIFGALMAN